MKSLKNKIMPYVLATSVAVYSFGFSPLTNRAFGFGEEMGVIGIEKGSEKIRDHLKKRKSKSYEKYEKAHKFMFDSFGLKEHNRKEREKYEKKKKKTK